MRSDGEGVMEHYFAGVPGWFNCQRFYADMVSRVPDGGTLVEVGCWCGRSLSCLLVEAVNSGKELRIYGVDHWQGSVGEQTLIDTAKAKDIGAICRENCQRSGYPFKLLELPSVEAAKLFDDSAIDFLFLDASHDRASVEADIDAWLPKVKSGGIVAGHDAGHPGVQGAVFSRFADLWIAQGCWFTEK